jgi:general secretion pathway protein J
VRREAGFTLLEVLVAAAIMALISVLLWWTFAQTFKAIDMVRADSDMFREARQVTTRVPAEIGEAFLPTNVSPTSNAKFEFVGEDKGDTDRVHFDALAHTKFYADANESDQAEIEYYTEPQTRSGPKGKSGLYKLFRREAPVIDDRPEEGGSALVIAENVRKFELSYYDPQRDQWYDNWDTNKTDQAGKLPYAVRMKVTMVDSDGFDRTWATATILRLAKPSDQR